MTIKPDSLVSIAMLAALRISTWTARKFDRGATADVNSRANAREGAGRYNKYLLAGAESHAAVMRIASQARATHYAQTLPWTDEGWRILPTANYMQYVSAMRVIHQQFVDAVDMFCADYVNLRQQAQLTLGSLWNAADYPSVSDVRRRYRWAIEYSPVPSTSDIRLGLPADQISMIEASIGARLQDAVRLAVQDGWQRLHEAVSRLRAAAEPDARVYATTVDGVRAVCDVLARLNLTQDAQLESMRAMVETQLTGFDADDLRHDPQLRAHVARSADAIMQAMSSFYQPAPADEQVSL